MKIAPRVTGDRPLLAIDYKYNIGKCVGFIGTEVAGSTEPGNPFLSCFPDIHSNVSFCPVVCPHFLGKYFNTCNEIDNQNMMQQFDLELDKYCITQSDYFRLSTTVALGMGITYGDPV